MSKKILIVDDDESILDALRLILEEYSYEVETITDGRQTIPTITRFHPNIVLLDVLLSGSDGREICAQIKQTQSLSHIPVIMISAHPSAKKGADTAGADGFLAKPFDTQDLIHIVEQKIPH